MMILELSSVHEFVNKIVMLNIIPKSTTQVLIYGS